MCPNIVSPFSYPETCDVWSVSRIVKNDLECWLALPSFEVKHSSYI